MESSTHHKRGGISREDAFIVNVCIIFAFVFVKVGGGTGRSLTERLCRGRRAEDGKISGRVPREVSSGVLRTDMLL